MIIANFADQLVGNDDGTACIDGVNLVPREAACGSADHVLAYGRNFGDIEKLKGSVAELQDKLHAAIRVLPDLFWIKDTSGRYVLCNDEFDRFNGVERGGALGRMAEDFCDGPILELHRLTDQQALASMSPVTFEVKVPGTEHFGPRFYDVQKIAIRNAQGATAGILGMARDVTKKRLLEQELEARERQYRQLAEHLPDCLARYDAKGNLIYMNRALQELISIELGLSRHENPRADSTRMRNPWSLTLNNTVLHAASSCDKIVQTEVEFATVQGRTIVHEIRHVPEFGPNGELVSVLAIGRDVTARKRAEQELSTKELELKRLAYHDSLTGLANRVTFGKTLQDELDAAVTRKGKVALLLLDVDRFKSINDSLGHVAGDELLQNFARLLKELVPAGCWLGRLGGDEFAVVVPSFEDIHEAEILAIRIMERIRQPMALRGTTVLVSVSIGLTVGPDDSPCETSLFRYADVALYRAKALGRARMCRYSVEMSRQADRRFEVEAMINEGLELGQFKTYFQAKVDMITGVIVGAEALCRWQHPWKGFIPPSEFIPIAEETGQITEIGRLVLKQACVFAVECSKICKADFTVAVNVSARQFLFGDFLTTLGLCLQETGCDASWLELEITESLLLANDNAVVQTLNAIVDLGIAITIDDFGTGYSALSYLRRFPISGLKVDQSFVRDMEVNEKQEVLVRAILSMAKGLGLKTVAEGVENDASAKKLAACGCDLGQGYLWHKPSPPEALLEVLRGSSAVAVQRESGQAAA